MFYVKGINYLGSQVTSTYTCMFETFDLAQADAKRLEEQNPEMVVMVEYESQDLDSIWKTYFPTASQASH
jgi:hypothetical protein